MRPSLIVLAVLFAGLTACTKTDQPSASAPGDPASGNLASADQTAAPVPPADATTAAQPDAGAYEAPAESSESSDQAVEAPDPPPPLPDYEQPPCPGDNYLWTPGYWNYAGAGYYWVPGAWVMAPWVDALWTPPWWGFENGSYLWHAGYWGPHIGFYGGINYGFGYTGRGYYGAYWNNGRVFYNRSATNVNVSVVHNVYNYSVASAHGERVSYNGGHGGLNVRATAQESAALHDRRTPPVAAQVQQAREASTNREQFAAGGHPHPAALAAPHPLATDYHAPAERAPVARPAGRPEPARPAPAPSAVERVRQQPEPRSQPAARPAAPEVRPAQPQSHADRVVRPESQPRPAAPEARPAQPESHANRTVRPESPPRPAPPEHAAPPTHPAPQVHPAPQEHPAPPHPAPPPEPKKKG